MEHNKFIYHSYSIGEKHFEFHFSLVEKDAEHDFRPRWDFPAPLANPEDATLRELVFNLGMAELVSYWKAACPPIVEIRCGSLSAWQIDWWKKLYLNGLGEFFYVNKITPTDDFMTIVADNRRGSLPPSCGHPPRGGGLSGSLIPVGGGKDSIVTLEFLRESQSENCAFIIGDIRRAYDSAKVAGYADEQIIQVSRTIDPTLLELNSRGYLNGHTPFSAIVAFSSLVFAYLAKKKYIVLSNESSANEGNVADSDVNHQYSKSIEFERDFREYVSRLGRDLPEYFSLLRPLNELQITERFVKYPQYFGVFQSCNVGTKTNTWCCNCAKCLYVYVMLAAFLDDDTLLEIFGANLLEKPELAPVLEALVNPALDKPFECVGTREEVEVALQMARKRREYAGNCVPEKFLKIF